MTIDDETVFTGHIDPAEPRVKYLSPCFDRAEAEQVANWINQGNDHALEQGFELTVAYWLGDVLRVVESAGTTWEIEHNHEPDKDGRYAIGAGWAWTEVTETDTRHA